MTLERISRLEDTMNIKISPFGNMVENTCKVNSRTLFIDEKERYEESLDKLREYRVTRSNPGWSLESMVRKIIIDELKTGSNVSLTIIDSKYNTCWSFSVHEALRALIQNKSSLNEVLPEVIADDFITELAVHISREVMNLSAVLVDQSENRVYEKISKGETCGFHD